MTQLAIKLTKRELYEHYLSVRARLGRQIKEVNVVLESAVIPEPVNPDDIDFTSLPYASVNKIKKIIKFVSATYNVSPEDILSCRRTLKIVEARHICCYVARHVTHYSFPQIGRALSKDHSSIVHAVGRIEDRVKSDRDFALSVNELIERFKRNEI
jgi:chromosomal replication initiator protein